MSSYRTRRATTEDLGSLAELWQKTGFPVVELQKHFTDFQIAEDEQGKVAGAIALHIEASHGQIHSEAFADVALTDELRPALWRRLQAVAQNNGLFRLWTVEAAPWWREQAGFSKPTDEILEKLPEVYGARDAAWLTLRLKDERAEPDLLEQQMAMYKETKRIDLERLEKIGRFMRVLAFIIAALFFLLAMTVLVRYYTLRHHR
jgi:N-acetylglutamate synthase-like GNAT family acetyltransferase